MKTVITLVFCTLIFGACSYKNVTKEQNNFRLMESSYNIAKEYPTINKILQVKKPTGVGYIYNKDLIYSKDDGVYQSYVNNFWDEPLYKQIESRVVFELNKANIFITTLPSISSIKSDLLLEMVVYDFYQIVKEDNSKVKIQITLNLVDKKTKDLISSKNFLVEKELNSITPKEALNSYNQAFEEFIEKVIHWLNKSQ
ncbi:MAG: ABC-type transport auxiliary lipoprotein family protein [Arcobacteraceae bacterium]|jgi:ABC-type uncharacterized transport system auxiliary subunit|nr:ABC-type transport auxiliary lipoprotein family protein [Arcobacteraceae bacterium]